MFIFLVFLNIPLHAAEDLQSCGLQVGEMDDREPHAQMTWEDHYLLRVRWMQVGKDISIAQWLWQSRVSQLRQGNVNVSLHRRLTIS